MVFLTLRRQIQKNIPTTKVIAAIVQCLSKFEQILIINVIECLFLQKIIGSI